MTGITGNLVWPSSDAFTFAIPMVIAALIVVIVYRRDLVVLAVSAGAIVVATLLFTTSTRSYDGYWFITLTTALTLTFGMAIAAIPSKAAVKWIGVALLMIVAWRQPARIEDSKRFFKYPQYAPMLQRIARAGHARAGGARHQGDGLRGASDDGSALHLHDSWRPDRSERPSTPRSSAATAA